MSGGASSYTETRGVRTPLNTWMIVAPSVGLRLFRYAGEQRGEGQGICLPYFYNAFTSLDKEDLTACALARKSKVLLSLTSPRTEAEMNTHTYSE